MDDKMKEVLAQYIESLLGLIKSGGEFAAEQVPLVVQEKLMFDLIFYLTWLVIGLVGIGFGIWSFSKARKIWLEAKYATDWCCTWVFIGLASSILGVIAVVTTHSNVLKIWLAPRLYIIDWLMQVVSSK